MILQVPQNHEKLSTPKNQGNVGSHGETLPLSLAFFLGGNRSTSISADFDLKAAAPVPRSGAEKPLGVPNSNGQREEELDT